MMRTGLTMMAVMVAGALTLNAQAPQNPPATPQSPAPQAGTDRAPDRQTPISDAARAQAGQVLTITGCLKEEKDVPGLKPNIAEKTGIGDDYILTAVKMSPSSKVSGIALGNHYEIEGISKDELKKHLNHQVEITGTISPSSSKDDDAPDFHGTALKMLATTCSAQ